MAPVTSYGRCEKKILQRRKVIVKGPQHNGRSKNCCSCTFQSARAASINKSRWNISHCGLLSKAAICSSITATALRYFPPRRHDTHPSGNFTPSLRILLLTNTLFLKQFCAHSYEIKIIVLSTFNYIYTSKFILSRCEIPIDAFLVYYLDIIPFFFFLIHYVRFK